MALFRKKSAMPTAEQALPGRSEPLKVSGTHYVNNNRIVAPFPAGLRRGGVWAWGASGAPSGRSGSCRVCIRPRSATRVASRRTRRTKRCAPGHRAHRSRAGGLRPGEDRLRGSAEGVLGVTRPDAGHAARERRRHAVPIGYLLHQRRAARGGGEVEAACIRRGLRAEHGGITTEMLPAPEFFYAEDYHQQYLAKNPRGYCPDHSCGVSYESRV